MKSFYTLAATFFFLFLQSSAWAQLIPNGKIDNISELIGMDTIYVPMGDGTLLATTIALPVFQDSIMTNMTIGGNTYSIEIIPKGTQFVVTDSANISPQSYQLPMIFTRTPYNRVGSDQIGFFPFLGYAYAIQDMRGRYASEGVYFPMYSDSWQKEPYHPSITVPLDVTNSSDPNNALKHHDGSQSVYYLADSARRVKDVNADGLLDTILYTNGQMGMFGASALGNSQYQALADMPFTKPNPLKCILPIVGTNEHFQTTLFHNGVYRHSLVNGWITGQMMDLNDNLNAIDTSIFNNLHSSADYGYTNKVNVANDFIDWFVSERFSNSPSGAYPASLLRKDLDASKAPINQQGVSDPNGNVSRYKNLNVPAYHLTGWWDIFINGQIETFNKIRAANPQLTQRLIIGPWTHQTIGSREVGDMLYPENVLDLMKIDLDINPQDLLNDSTFFNKLYQSEILSWYRTYLGGEPWFIIPESSKWQTMGTNTIRIPAADYVIPYYEFLNYLGKKSALTGIPIEINDGNSVTALAIDAPLIDNPVLRLTEALVAPPMGIFENRPPVSMYISGPANDPNNINVGNYWLSADSMPFKKGIIEEYFYLHQNGSINKTAPAQNEGTLSYVANPNNPVYTIGGNNMIVEVPDHSRNSQGSMDYDNPDFKTITMDRNDVLAFATSPLADTMTFVGFPKAGIYAKGKTTAFTTPKTNFDIMVRILDVYPDGREMLITEGTVNGKAKDYAASMAEGTANDSIAFTNIDNNSYAYFQFELLPLGHTFGKGHQIKILLSSSNYPKYQSNPHVPTNDGEFFRWAPGETKTYNYNGQILSAQNAEITYEFNPQLPAYIMLPRLDSSYFAGLNQLRDEASLIHIFPNPAQEEISVVWKKRIEGKVYLQDLSGSVLRSFSVSKKQGQLKIDVSDLASGVYLLNIPTLGQSKKLVISK